MKPVRLKCTSKPYKGETLHLERIKKGLVLVDERDEDVAMIRSADASVRIQLPSFWASRYLVIAGDDGKALSFEPDAKATARIRELIDDCLGQDPAATAATYRRLAIRNLLIGAGSFLLGAIITCASF